MRAAHNRMVYFIAGSVEFLAFSVYLGCRSADNEVHENQQRNIPPKRYTAFKKMTSAEKIVGIPVSGEFEEIIFDLPEPWREQTWHYVKFTRTDGSNWCGVFREKDRTNFLIDDLPTKGLALVVSGGHGYLIDINKKAKIKDLFTEPILDIYADKLNEIFYFSRWWDCKYLDTELNENVIHLPIECDGIFFNVRDGKKFSLKIEEIGADVNINTDYYIDLEERMVKKNAV